MMTSKIGEATLYRFKVNAHDYYFLGVFARASLSYLLGLPFARALDGHAVQDCFLEMLAKAAFS